MIGTGGSLKDCEEKTMMDPSFCHLVEVVIAAPLLADRYFKNGFCGDYPWSSRHWNFILKLAI